VNANNIIIDASKTQAKIMTIKKHLYDELTWPEIQKVVKEDRVILIPTATLEDHGHHLPINTDVIIAQEITRRAAERVPEDVLLMPPSPHGYSPHHADFPGGVYIEGQTFLDYMLDITDSLIGHGFRRILIYNTHGSGTPRVQQEAPGDTGGQRREQPRRGD
jgi:creatinine amidohydrolase